MSDLGKLLIRLTGVRGEVLWRSTQPGGQRRRSLDTSNVSGLSGFVAKTRVDRRRRTTTAWYGTAPRSAAPASGPATE